MPTLNESPAPQAKLQDTVTDYQPRHADARRAADLQDGDDREPDSEELLDAEEWLDWFGTLSDSQRLAQRDDLWVSGLKAGVTLQILGDLYGVSRERVRQVTKAAGLSAHELRAARSAQAKRRERHLCRRIYGMSLTYPEMTIDELAEACECDERLILKALDNRRPLHVPIQRKATSQRTSDEDLISALRQWAAQSGHLTSDDYTLWAKEHGIPSAQTVCIRFGGWNAGLTAAGVDLAHTRGDRHPQLDDDTLWATVYEFMTSDSTSFTAQGYSQWAHEHDRASMATLRNRLGLWSEVWSRGQRLLRYAASSDGSWAWAERVLRIVPGEVERNLISADACVAALVEVSARTTGTMTVARYESARAAGQPASAAIQHQLGSWILALHRAGLDDRMSGKARGRVERGEVVLDPPR